MGVRLETRTPPLLMVLGDDPQIPAAFHRMLKTLELRLCFARNADEGFGLIRVEVPDVIVADYLIPGMDSLAFLGHIRRRHPKVEGILYTGATPLPIEAQLGIPVVPKPCEPDKLKQMICGLAGIERSA